MEIADGRVVTYRYEVRDPDGVTREVTPDDAPRITLFGRGGELPAVAGRMAGAVAGDRLTFALAPEEALGAHDPSLVHVVPRARWHAAEPALGPVELEVVAEGGERVVVSGRVVAFDAEQVVFDRNHPLAGVSLTFDLTVDDVRTATPDEERAGAALPFPLDLFAKRDFPGPVGDLMRRHATASMCPPFPWGHWQVADLLAARVDRLPGDLIELGVGLGGMSMLLGERVRDAGRTVYALDTYEGLPAPDPVRDNPYFLTGLYRGAEPLIDRFRAALERAALDDVVCPVPGLFADTLPTLPPDARFCFAHIDADLYHSVHDALAGVWDRMVEGGVVVIDDFFHHAQGPARACADFFAARGLRPVYHVLFPYAVYVVKAEPPASRWRRSLDGNTYALDGLRANPLLRDAVRASLARCVPGTRPHANAARLLGLIDADADRNADIYDYWSALEGFWDGIAAGFSAVTPI